MKRGILSTAGTLLVCLTVSSVANAAGTEAAAFLDIPVGGGPAAMGSAYTALANDAYAATYNPAGLGALKSTQFSGQHLSYLDSLHYEYLSFALPFQTTNCDGPCSRSALGGSVQYLGSGDIGATDNFGNSAGTFSSYYVSYNIAYGRTFGDKLSLGLTTKMISAKIDDVKANAYAVDLGSRYALQENLILAMTVNNVGSKLKFLNEGDSLPVAFHLAAAYKPSSRWLLSSEVIVPKEGDVSAHVGGEWRVAGPMSLRAGYRTETVKNLSPLAGMSAGVGLGLWGQEFSYAYLPYGDLGNTHYFSIVMKFEEHAQPQNIKQAKAQKTEKAPEVVPVSEQASAPAAWRKLHNYKDLWDMLNNIEKQAELQRQTLGPI